jgi:carboxynorspermidine decarboxylase
MDSLSNIPTPPNVADLAAIKRNLSVAKKLKSETGCKLLLATKACSMFALFPLFAEALDGTTASGLYEAKLGSQHFGGEVHAYAPAYSEDEIEALIPLCDHIYFNSAAQLKRFAPRFAHAKIGLRLNPEFSQVTNASIYDPSSEQSRFGMTLSEITDNQLREVDILHVHNLCENMAADSVALIDWLMQHAAHLLRHVSAVNLGGGHYVTHAEYDLDALIAKINELKTRFDVEVILESGGAWAYDAGYLVASVLDVIERSCASAFGGSQDDHNASFCESQSDCAESPSHHIAILDTSATCHMPDVLEMPYRPNVIGDTPKGAHRYQLTGRTCLTGDIIGDYAFEAPLKVGDTVIFTDMLQYSMVKNTTFNGVPLPEIGVLEEDGTYRCVKRFGYEDFERRLS